MQGHQRKKGWNGEGGDSGGARRSSAWPWPGRAGRHSGDVTGARRAGAPGTGPLTGSRCRSGFAGGKDRGIGRQCPGVGTREPRCRSLRRRSAALHVLRGGVAGGPGPLEVKAAQVAADVQHLADEVEPGGLQRFQGLG